MASNGSGNWQSEANSSVSHSQLLQMVSQLRDLEARALTPAMDSVGNGNGATLSMTSQQASNGSSAQIHGVMDMGDGFRSIRSVEEAQGSVQTQYPNDSQSVMLAGAEANADIENAVLEDEGRAQGSEPERVASRQGRGRGRPRGRGRGRGVQSSVKQTQSAQRGGPGGSGPKRTKGRGKVEVSASEEEPGGRRTSKRRRHVVQYGARVEDGFVEKTFEEGPTAESNGAVYLSASISQRNYKGVLFDTTSLGIDGDGTTLEQILRAHLLRFDAAGEVEWELKPARLQPVQRKKLMRSTPISEETFPNQVKSIAELGKYELEMRKKIEGMTKIPHVIVVGAGLSGLCCARKLLGFGLKVTVLEAADRVGGRCFTKEFQEKAKVDLGAGWIHGIKGNPLTKIARENHIELFAAGTGQLMPMIDCTGRLIDRSKDNEIEKVFNDGLSHAAALGVVESAFESIYFPHSERLSEEYHGQVVERNSELRFSYSRYGARRVLPFEKRFIEDVATYSQLSVAEVMEVSYVMEGICETIELVVSKAVYEHGSLGEAVHEYFLKTLPDADALDHRLLHWHMSNLEYANATNLDELSLQYWNQDDPYTFNGAHCLLRQGFGGLTQVLAQNVTFSGGSLELQHQVESIHWADDGVVLHGSRSNMASEGNPVNVASTAADPFEIVADYCVCTLPLGVLKAKQVAFHPPLPEWKSAAIDRLGFGVLDKVVLVFEASFWDPFPVIGHVSEVPGEHYMFVNLKPLTGMPILLSLVSGRTAEKMEEKDEQVAINECMACLRRIYPERPVPPPKEYHITKWRKNPLALGSYSYIRKGSSPDDIRYLAKPLLGRVFFAGEATTTTHLASAHGAVMTGREQAVKLIETIAQS